MWNPQNNYYEMTAAKVLSPPLAYNDVARLGDVYTYYSIAGYQSGTQQTFNTSDKYEDFLFNKLIQDALHLPKTDHPNHKLFLDYFVKATSTGPLKFSILLNYYDINKNLVGSSPDYQVSNNDNDIDMEIIADGFNIPPNSYYVFLAVSNLSPTPLIFTFLHAKLHIAQAQEQLNNDKQLLKTTDNSFFVLLGGLGGTPSPSIPSNLTIDTLTINNTKPSGISSLTFQDSTHSTAIILDQGNLNISGNIDLQQHTITNIKEPVASQDAANYGTVLTESSKVYSRVMGKIVSGYLSNRGGIVQGDLEIWSRSIEATGNRFSLTGDTIDFNNLEEMGDGNSLGQQITFKTSYSTNQLGIINYNFLQKIPKLNISCGNNMMSLTDEIVIFNQDIHMSLKNIRNTANPSEPQDVATKFYVDEEIKKIPTGDDGWKTLITPYNDACEVIAQGGLFINQNLNTERSYISGEGIFIDSLNATLHLRAGSGSIDCSNGRLTNVANPQYSTDAINLGYFQQNNAQIKPSVVAGRLNAFNSHTSFSPGVSTEILSVTVNNTFLNTHMLLTLNINQLNFINAYNFTITYQINGGLILNCVQYLYENTDKIKLLPINISDIILPNTSTTPINIKLFMIPTTFQKELITLNTIDNSFITVKIEPIQTNSNPNITTVIGFMP